MKPWMSLWNEESFTKNGSRQASITTNIFSSTQLVKTNSDTKITSAMYKSIQLPTNSSHFITYSLILKKDTSALVVSIKIIKHQSDKIVN